MYVSPYLNRCRKMVLSYMFSALRCVYISVEATAASTFYLPLIFVIIGCYYLDTDAGVHFGNTIKVFQCHTCFKQYMVVLTIHGLTIRLLIVTVTSLARLRLPEQEVIEFSRYNITKSEDSTFRRCTYTIGASKMRIGLSNGTTVGII